MSETLNSASYTIGEGKSSWCVTVRGDSELIEFLRIHGSRAIRELYESQKKESQRPTGPRRPCGCPDK